MKTTYKEYLKRTAEEDKVIEESKTRRRIIRNHFYKNALYKKGDEVEWIDSDGNDCCGRIEEIEYREVDDVFIYRMRITSPLLKERDIDIVAELGVTPRE